jgi:hypothetical protein
MNNLADRLSQSAGSMLHPWGSRSPAPLMHAPPPKELICERGCDNAGQACAQRRSRRARPAVMDSSPHSGNSQSWGTASVTKTESVRNPAPISLHPLSKVPR